MNQCGARGKLSHTLWTLSQTWPQQISLEPKCGQPLVCCNWQSSIYVPVWSSCSGLAQREAASRLTMQAFIEKQSLFHCALSPQAQVSTVAKPSVQHQTQKRTADSRMSDRQARRKTDSQSAEPRPRPQYSKYTPDGTLICPDYNTRGCSLSKCWYKSLNAVHCCDVWGCYKEHPRWDH